MSWPHTMSRVISKKKRKAEKIIAKADDDDEEGTQTISLPALFPSSSTHTLYTQRNHIYFNMDITSESIFSLNKELRALESKLRVLSVTQGIDTSTTPIYLHITTDGGSIHAAFSAVDCIKNLSVPVYTIVDGFVASAGTLISLAGKKRYIRENAYMLIHELRSGVWGKMSSIEEEVENLKKVMEHIYQFYLSHTTLPKKRLEKILAKDVIWNAEESIAKGIVEEVYTK